MQHTLKIAPEYFEAVASGRKTVEIRREDDKIFAVNDLLVLREWDYHRLTPLQQNVYQRIKKVGTAPHNTLALKKYNEAIQAGYTGRTCRVQVTHILREPPYVPPGYAALSIHLLT